MLKQQDVEALRAMVIDRAQSGPEYRKRLMAEPRAAFRELDIDLPPGFKVTVLESTATSHYLVLPPRDGDELSDEDLEAVAGGSCYSWITRKKKTDSTYGTAWRTRKSSPPKTCSITSDR